MDGLEELLTRESEGGCTLLGLSLFVSVSWRHRAAFHEREEGTRETTGLDLQVTSVQLSSLHRSAPGERNLLCEMTTQSRRPRSP